ncbi:MAG: endonuclease/exonuclease/phosphatase family protein [Deltaproteobacteria bacterium]|nr:endonuclease/exonuclease/phosphatase family protein [Deltaproteobacteria bacterium]
MRRFNWVVVMTAIAAAALFAVACGDDDDDNDSSEDDADDDAGDDDTDAVPAFLSVVTFNAGLAHGFVPYADERVSAVGQALAELDTHLACLQEVWEPEDIASILAETEANFPYVHRQDSHADWLELPDEPAPCDDLTDVLDCAEANCSDVSGAEFTDCMLLGCIFDLSQLEIPCFNCLAANIDKSIDDIADVCTNPGPPPLQYEGANGLLVLSKFPLSETSALELDYFLITRLVLHARVETDNGPVHAYCTHLSTDISGLPYHGTFEDFAEENLAQAEAILEFIDETSNGEPAVLLGDFNSGPDTDALDGNYADTWDTLSGAFHDPLFAGSPDVCTWCSDNPLTDMDRDAMIDHVFFSGFDTDALSASVIFDEDAGSTPRLSDHYGVRATYGN